MTSVLAHHEAGHAVAMVALDIPILDVQLAEVTPGAAGGVRPVPAGNGDRYRHAVCWLAGYPAGVRAIQMLEPAEDFAGLEIEQWLGSGDDRELAQKAAGDRFDEAEHDAELLVARHWVAITALAEELEETGALSGLDVEGLVRPLLQ